METDKRLFDRPTMNELVKFYRDHPAGAKPTIPLTIAYIAENPLTFHFCPEFQGRRANPVEQRRSRPGVACMNPLSVDQDPFDENQGRPDTLSGNKDNNMDDDNEHDNFSKHVFDMGYENNDSDDSDNRNESDDDSSPNDGATAIHPKAAQFGHWLLGTEHHLRCATQPFKTRALTNSEMDKAFGTIEGLGAYVRAAQLVQPALMHFVRFSPSPANVGQCLVSCSTTNSSPTDASFAETTVTSVDGSTTKHDAPLATVQGEIDPVVEQ